MILVQLWYKATPVNMLVDSL